MAESLVEWLSACLAADEEAARDVETEGRWRAATNVGDYYNVGVVLAGGSGDEGDRIARCGVEGLEDGERRAAHIAAWDPARVLAEVAAKRRILEQYRKALQSKDWPACSALEEVLPVLALPYAGRDGYRDEWVPE